MIYVCPCGCGSDGYIAFRPAPSPSWDWDGNAAHPTLTPSVHRVTMRTGDEAKTHWHGWLRAGEWVSC
ncbi:DUF6527 family protein [Zavarzinia sp.]|uniref:DUF6527 family protein n=1 Tax=Zavarzinia sp. TaxID=2027920 RepID=UPI003BB6650C